MFVNLSRSATLEYRLDAAAEIFDVQPVLDISAIAIDWQRSAGQ